MTQPVPYTLTPLEQAVGVVTLFIEDGWTIHPVKQARIIDPPEEQS